MDYEKRKYYVITDTDADREVHREGCVRLLSPARYTYLGEYYSPMAAVVAALKTYPSTSSCKTCNPG